MKIWIIYDSLFGNTEKIAWTIGNAFGSGEDVRVCKVEKLIPEQIKDAELLIVGSPTRGFRPTEAMTSFIKGIPKRSLESARGVAAYDTRIELEFFKSSIFRKLVHMGGYAAKPIAKALVKKGGILVLPPEGFYVMEPEGPLREGETERATAWAKQILEATGIE
jgi:flavodoxin I